MRPHPGCGRSGAELVSVGGALDTSTWCCSCGSTFELTRALDNHLIEEAARTLGAIAILARRVQLLAGQGRPTASARALLDSRLSRLFEIFETGRALTGPLVPDEPTPEEGSES